MSHIRTIEEEENIIINVLHGKKLNTDSFFCNICDFIYEEYLTDKTRHMSPSQFIYNYTEIIVPDNYFYSFYLIPRDKRRQYNQGHFKEQLAFIATQDGINVYIACILNFSRFTSDIEYRKLESEIAYIAEGVEIYL